MDLSHGCASASRRLRALCACRCGPQSYAHGVRRGRRRSAGALAAASFSLAAELGLLSHAVAVAVTTSKEYEAELAEFHVANLAEARGLLGLLRGGFLSTSQDIATALAFPADGLSSPEPCRVSAFFRSEEIDESVEVPCRGVGGMDGSLGSALLAYLQRGVSGELDDVLERKSDDWKDGGDGDNRRKRDYEQEVWPCAAQTAAVEVRSPVFAGLPASSAGASELKTALWGAAAWLRSCGVGGVQHSWPTSFADWDSLRIRTADALGALAGVRSDGASLMCAESLKFGYGDTSQDPQGIAIEEPQTDGEFVDQGVGEERARLPRGKVLRCPRCAKAVAADRSAQVELLEIRRRLIEARWEPSLPRAEQAREANCAGADRRTEMWLVDARTAGGANALITAVEKLPCGMCELLAIDRFVNAGGASTDEAVQAAAALMKVRCAAAAPDVVEMDTLPQTINVLENAVWNGVGFPLLHEAAARAMLQLLRAGRLSSVVESGDLARRLCDVGFVNNASFADTTTKYYRDVRPPHVNLNVPFGSSKGVSWIRDYEHWALRLWGGRFAELGGKEIQSQSLDPLRMALIYLDLASAAPLPSQTGASLAVAGLWLSEATRSLDDKNPAGEGVAATGSVSREARQNDVSWISSYPRLDGTASRHDGVKDGSRSRLPLQRALHNAVERIAETAHRLATELLSPGAQFIILQASTLSLRSSSQSHFVEADATRISQLSMSSAQRRLLFLAGQLPFWTPPIPLIADAAGLTEVAGRLHESFARRLSALDPQEINTLPGPVGALAAPLGLYESALSDGRARRSRTLRATALTATLNMMSEYGARLTEPVVPEVMSLRQHAFVGVRGIHIGPHSADISFERPRIERASAPCFSSAFASSIVTGVRDADDASIGVPVLGRFLFGSSGHHPFQRVIGTGDAVDALLSLHRLVALAADSEHERHDMFCEAQGIACGNAFGVITELRAAARAVAAHQRSTFPSSATSVAGQICASQYLSLRCTTASWKRAYADSGRSSGASSELQLDTVGLEVVAQSVETSLSEPLARLAAALTAYIESFGVSAASDFTRARQICNLRAVARLLSAGTAPAASAELGGAELVVRKPMELPTRMAWLQRLADVHAGLLQRLGFVNFDPGQCWDNMFNFGICCSIGDFASECWQRGFSQTRCCAGLAARDVATSDAEAAAIHLAEGLCRQPTGERYAMAVLSWLQSPHGHSRSGRALSAVLVDVLDEEAQACSAQGMELTQQKETESSVAALPSRGSHRNDEAGSRPFKKDVRFGGTAAGLEHWVPGLWSGRVPSFKTELQPLVRSQPDEYSPREADEASVSISLRELERQAELERDLFEGDQGARAVRSVGADTSAVALASALPLVRSLQQFSAKLQSVHGRAALSAANAASAVASVASANVGSEAPDGTFAQGVAWVRLQPGEAVALRAGDRIRLGRSDDLRTGSAQKRGSNVPVHEEAEILDVLEMVGGGKESRRPGRPLHRVRILKGGSERFCDLAEPGWTVSALRPGTPSSTDLSLPARDRAQQQPVWPECIQQGETIRGTGGAGVFVNLLGLGISQGCFRDDCSHSDHFSSKSPAECSRICASVRACRWWSFWATYTDGICWLRRHDQQRVPMETGASGPADCVPPPVSRSVRNMPGAGQLASATEERTLFDLARTSGKNLDPDQALHQWDLVNVLGEFGHKTPSQVQSEGYSSLQRSAMNFARRSERLRYRSAATW
eukprot:TRINITY_DN34657_c0_g1_i1.p1 TRINITY_DN34657_c0_g1~~TRINITY_DN34657_c0_g1_i1.p1  ORF type:complete len:1753 (-),score=234.69 TRINITY_DN34657_c0_g1_i1:81-5276(-)